MNPAKPAGPFKPLIVIAVIFASVSAVVAISRLRAPKDLIPWRTDFAAAQSESRTQNKPIFAYFTATWCPACEELKRTTWSDRNVEVALQKFIPCKIDVDDHPDLAAHYVTDGLLPTMLIMDDAGTPREAYTGLLDPAALLDWVKRH